MKKRNLTSLSEFIDEKVGHKGTDKRDKYDKEFEDFKSGILATELQRGETSGFVENFDREKFIKNLHTKRTKKG